jgi:hypothetical protein
MLTLVAENDRKYRMAGSTRGNFELDSDAESTEGFDRM